MIDKIMKEHGVSGYRLAKDSGISQSLIARWVTGERDPKGMSIENASKIAKVLKITIDELWEAIK